MAEFQPDFTPTKFRNKKGKIVTAYSAADDVAFAHRGFARIGEAAPPAKTAAKKTTTKKVSAAKPATPVKN